jgi:hypothetical protein
MIRKIFYLFVCVVVMSSCSRCGSNNTKSGQEFGSDAAPDSSSLPVDPQTMSSLVQNIASPIEVSALIKSLKVPFREKYLAPTNIDNFNTNNQKAFILGILTADLGYLNMYSQTSSVIKYITSIKTLADGLNIGQFFDFTTLKRLATNNENIDSLMFISTHSFNTMDEYLRKNKRSNLSALMIAGVYLEGMYITTQVAKDQPSVKLNENIGEQKVIFGPLMFLLYNFKKDPYFANLIADFETIKKELDPITITVEKGEATQAVVNGMLTIKQNEKTNINITDDQVKRIIAQTEKVRTKLIKQ